MRKNLIIITAIAIVYKLLGFVREAILAYFYGATFTVDAYLMAIAIPTIVFGWLTSVATAFTPAYAELYCNDQSKAQRFFGMLLSDAFVIGLVLSILGFSLAPYLVQLVAPGFTGEVYELCLKYLKITVWSTIILCPCRLLIAYLDYHDKYIHSNISTLLINTVQIAVIFLCANIGSQYLSFAYLLSYGAELAALIVFSMRAPQKYRLSLGVTPEIKNLLRSLLPIFISCMIQELNILVDKSFASSLAEGSVAALNYAAQMRALVYSVFATGIMTVSYPTLSKLASQKDTEAYKAGINNFIRPLILLFVPLAVGGILLAQPIISLVYERGAFNQDATLRTYQAMRMYFLGLAPLVLYDYIIKIYYTQKRMKAVMLLGGVTVAANILLNSLLVSSMQTNGLSLATSLASIITLPLAIFLLNKNTKFLSLRENGILLSNCFVAAAVMGAAVYFGYPLVESLFPAGIVWELIRMVAVVGVGAAVYGGVLVALKVDDVKKMLSGLVRKKH